MLERNGIEAAESAVEEVGGDDTWLVEFKMKPLSRNHHPYVKARKKGAKNVAHERSFANSL
jgi:hypothetical protein